jgi:uncharacterized membrane protein YgcG
MASDVLDTPLLEISAQGDTLTIREALQGIHIWGGIGSGKTSGSGAAIAGALLRAQFGGIVCCAKPEEVDTWVRYAKAHGRLDSLLVFDERLSFNFMDHAMARNGMDGIGNVVDYVMRVVEFAKVASGGSAGKDNEPFWDDAIRQALSHAIPLLYAAHGTVGVSGILDFVTSAAAKEEQYVDDKFDSFAKDTLRKALDSPMVPIDKAALNSLMHYWFRQWPSIPEKTRGNIVITLTTRLDRFKRGRLRRMFCSNTTVLPEMTFHGAIILLAMPALTFNEDGLIAQQVFKLAWQMAVQSRNGLEVSQQTGPVFCFADEAQYFLSTRDDEFLSTARASRACVVLLSQNLPSYIARLGKDNADAVEGLIGKCATQIFHLNACNRTNAYASQLIGRGIHRRASTGRNQGVNYSRGMNSGSNTSSGTSSNSGYSSSKGGGGTNSSSGSNSGSGNSWGDNVGRGTSEGQTWGTSEQMDNIIEPNFFAGQLICGGPANNGLVTAIWFKAGGNFKAGRGGNFIVATFRQPS